jgi:hypothetical protein
VLPSTTTANTVTPAGALSFARRPNATTLHARHASYANASGMSSSVFPRTGTVTAALISG